MKKSNKILKRDINRLGRNMAAILVIIGICLLPSLYAWFNIGANKNPYGNLQGVKIAVTNLDRPTTFDGRDIFVGDDIIKNLKQNDQLGWTFVDQREAMDGLKRGDFYAAIFIPEDFSESFVSIMKGEEIRFPKLDYYVNEKLNAIAPKITSSGLDALETQINSKFVAMTSEVLAEELKKGSGEFVEIEGEKRQDALNSLMNVESNLLSYHENLKTMDDKLVRMEGLMKDVRRQVVSMKGVVKKGQLTLADSKALLDETRRESEKIIRAYDDLMNDMERMNVLAGNYSGKKYQSLDKDLSLAGRESDAALRGFQRVNTLSGEILREFESIDPIPDEMKPLNLSGQWRNIHDRNGKILSTLESQRKTVENSLNALEKSYDQMSDLLDESSKNHRQTRDEFRTAVPPMLMQNMDLLNQVHGRFSSTLSTMPLLLDEFDKVLGEMDSLIDDSRKTIDTSLTSLERAENTVETLRVDLSQLARGPLYKKIEEIPAMDSEKFSAFMGEPVHMEEHAIYKSDNYGSAMTPFFTNLALWVGGMILISILKIDVDRDEDIPEFTFAEGYMGRFKLFVLLGLVQAFIVSVGDLAILKVQCENPVLFVATALLSSLAYVSIIFSLTGTFRNIGKAIAVIVLILQIPGASGTYPIEMMAPFFQSIYPFLPFHYGIDGLRETMMGIYWPHFAKDWLILISYIPLSFLLGLYGPKILSSLSRTFDGRLAESELIHADYPHDEEPTDGDLVVTILRGDEAMLSKIRYKQEHFFETYKKRKYYAFVALFVIPSICLILLFNMETKIRYLVTWVISIIAFATYLIWLELRYDRYENERKLMNLSEEELLNHIRRNDHENDLESR
ncbi:YhgE/Pip domain protein [Aedoeadaptatus coxii]|uniref:YhgE/Pip domain protein n=1 Tax=Aedoeadaptatus coxii TaxID=755172 RepID=A0A134AH37_9FIRM|nr:YhgE/Pip domain-containing protein [Peptoniphilus coxii]KXB67011.1 YhgE/Pip domain protein [Peptoniphilus coxii]